MKSLFSAMSHMALTLACLIGGSPVFAQTLRIGPLDIGQGYEDRYKEVSLSLGSRVLTTENESFTVLFTDNSDFPETYILGEQLEAHKRRGLFELGYAWGNFTDWHYEVAYSWSTGMVRSSSLGGGVGYNLSVRDGRVVLRGVMAAHMTLIQQDIGTMELSGFNQLNFTIKEDVYLNSVDVSIRRRNLELRPKVEIVVRATEQIQIHAHAGLALPVPVNRGFLRFDGTGEEGEEFTKVKTRDEGVLMQVAGEAWEGRFLPHRAIGPTLGIKIAYNLYRY